MSHRFLTADGAGRRIAVGQRKSPAGRAALAAAAFTAAAVSAAIVAAISVDSAATTGAIAAARAGEAIASVARPTASTPGPMAPTASTPIGLVRPHPTRGDVNRFLGLALGRRLSPIRGRRHSGQQRRQSNRRGLEPPRPAAGLPQQRQAWGNDVRNNFNHWDMYGAGWYQNHPDAWLAAGWGAGAAWNAATWPAIGAWFGGYGGYGGSGTGPIDYDYGNNIVYQNNDVYIDGQDVDTATQYYNQVADQADNGAEAAADENGAVAAAGRLRADPRRAATVEQPPCNWPSTSRESSAAITPTRWPTRPRPSKDRSTRRRSAWLGRWATISRRCSKPGSTT